MFIDIKRGNLSNVARKSVPRRMVRDGDTPIGQDQEKSEQFASCSEGLTSSQCRVLSVGCQIIWRNRVEPLGRETYPG